MTNGQDCSYDQNDGLMSFYSLFDQTPLMTNLLLKILIWYDRTKSKADCIFDRNFRFLKNLDLKYKKLCNLWFCYKSRNKRNFRKIWSQMILGTLTQWYHNGWNLYINGNKMFWELLQHTAWVFSISRHLHFSIRTIVFLPIHINVSD